MAELARERSVLKPSQLNALARDLLEGAFAQVWVQAEISNFSRPASGHLYFTLKDDRAQVRCAMFKQKAMYLRFAPRDGMQVLVRGRLTVYEARGEYQLALEHMEEAGEGALRQAFEALKQRLAAEGVFDKERKQPLPKFLGHLGVITSPRGAAIRDVLSVLARRFPMLSVDVLPVAVQGQGAAAEIRDMLDRAAASGRYDALLLTRGGGSLEDLWAFNDEALARAIADCPIPVVSAVGHEIDFSLADFAADLRAPTPSAAAELLVPDRAELVQHLAQLARRVEVAVHRKQTALAQRADHAGLRLQAQQPRLRLERGLNRLGGMRGRLDAVLMAGISARIARLRDHAERLERQHPRSRLAAQAHRSALLEQRLASATRRRLDQHRLQLQGLARTLVSVSPLATLARGYAVLRDRASGAVLRRAQDALPGQVVDAMLAEGSLGLVVTERRE